jgi:outer membrane protease
MGGIEHFQNKHKNKDIYVLGSGATLNFIKPDFFKNKITVCVNDVAEIYLPKTQYVVTKYHQEAIEYAKKLPKSKIIVSRGDKGNTYTDLSPNIDNLFSFEHNYNKCENSNVYSDWPKNSTKALYVSWSSITSAMHFAAFLGAKNIIMVGHDSGSLDDQNWVKGYVTETWSAVARDAAMQRNKLFESQSLAVKKKLIELYNCNIYSLNPFINYNLEGVSYRGQNQIN